MAEPRSEDSSNSKFKTSKKDAFFKKYKSEDQVKLRGDSIYNNFDGIEYVNLPLNDIESLEQRVKSMLDFDFMSKDWSSIQESEPLPVILFSVLQNIPIKVKTYRVRFFNDESSIIPISYEIMKKKSFQSGSKSRLVQNKNLYGHIFRKVKSSSFKLDIKNIKTKQDLINLNSRTDGRYAAYLPMFYTAGADEYLMYRVSSECVPIFRNDFKLQIFNLYLSIDYWSELESVQKLKAYFEILTSEPFSLNKFNATKPESLSMSHSAIILNLLLNSILFECSIRDSMIICGLKGIFTELIDYLLSDSPAVTSKQFADLISNNIRTVVFCNCTEFNIPTMTDDGKVGVGTAFIDDFTDYNSILGDMLTWASSNKLYNMAKAVKYLTNNPDRHSVLLTEFICGIPNMIGYTSSDQVSAVKRQIYTGRKILHEHYSIDKKEAYDRAVHDWEVNKELMVDQYGEEFYIEQKNKYFEEKTYEFDYIPFDFNCENSELFQNFSRYVSDFTTDTSSFPIDKILNEQGVLLKAFDAQTPNSADISVKIKIPISNDRISKLIKTKAQNFNSKHFDDSVTITLKTKRSLVAVTPIKNLLNLENVFRGGYNRELSYVENLKNIIPYLISQGNRTIPGPKQIRFIFVVPWSDNMYNQSIGFYGLSIQKRMPVIAKPTGIFLRDYADIILATSTGRYLCIFFDFSVFDGSCMNYIQRFIYERFKVYFNFIWQDGITIGELLSALQAQKYRCVMVVFYAGEYHIFFLDMILSGELLTNYKDSVINYSLIRCAIDLLLNKMPMLEIPIENNLRINGDDSFFKIHLNNAMITETREPKNKRRKGQGGMIRKINMVFDFKSTMSGWLDELPGQFSKIGFKLSDAKGGASLRNAEYLKVWIILGLVFTNWRVQAFTQEKTNVQAHNTMIGGLSGLCRTMVERGMSSTTLYKYVKLMALSGRRMTTGTFFINNFIDLFNPRSGYNLAINNKLFALPNSSIFSLYVFMHSKTGSVPNHVISRYLLNNFEPTSKSHLDEFADKIASNKIEFISSTLNVPPKVNSEEYYNTRDVGKIKASLYAYQQLKELGFRPSKSTAYFNGFKTYISSGLTSSKVPRAVSMINYEKANASYFENITSAAYPVGPYTPEMLILANIIIDKNQDFKSYKFTNDLTNMAIGSDPTFFMFKDILGYASVDSHVGYERDIIDIIRSYDPTYPRELSQEVLLNTLLKPDILSNPVAFTLMCVLLGLNESVAEVIRKTLNDNYLIYSVQSNIFNYSSVSQFINIWNFDVVNMREKLNLGQTSGELSMVDRLVTLMGFMYLVSSTEHLQDEVIINGIDVLVTGGVRDVVAGSRSF